MAYQSLYRRRRPLNFAEMTGQEHITRTLSNALSSDRLAHAYLFCGPRGTGKTTAAKILARTMNCEHYPVAEPCGQCVPCQNIAAGVSIDVIEMDAASNRGIDEIRELRERTRYASGESRFKVYIIDEAHMLTPEACNAFLKTLEEPPQNVVFILATTDPSRLPSTIVSRCQRFDFHLLSVEQIHGRLVHVLAEEGWQAEQEAVYLIARLADGSLRDALGILEQCSAYGEDQITADQVRAVTGATRVEVIGALVRAAADNNLDSGLEIIEQVIYSGRDLHLLMRDLIFVFSRLLLNEDKSEAAVRDQDHGFAMLVKENRGLVERHILLDAVELLHEVSGELRHPHFPHYVLEVAFIRLVRLLHGRLKPVSILDQEPDMPMKRSDQKPKDEQKFTGFLDQESSHRKEEQQPESEEAFLSRTTGQKGSVDPDELFSRLQENWPRLLQEIKRKQKSTAAWLEPATLEECRGDLVCLSYASQYSIHRERIMGDSHRNLVEGILSLFLRVPVKIRAVVSEATDETNRAKDEPAQSSSLARNGPETKPKKAPSVEEAMEIFGGKIIEGEGQEEI